VMAWRDGGRQWAAAMALCLGLLILLPPVAGFALFFVFLHSPQHLARTRTLLTGMPFSTWLMTGAVLSGVAIAGWIGLQRLLPAHIDAAMPAQAFQLIASVAVPHLLLSRWLEKRLDRTKPTCARPLMWRTGSQVGRKAPRHPRARWTEQNAVPQVTPAIPPQSPSRIATIGDQVAFDENRFDWK